MSAADSLLHTRLLQLLADQTALPLQELRPELTFRDLGVDSLGLVELIVSVENDLGIRFPAELDGVDENTTLEAAVRVLESLAGTEPEAKTETGTETEAAAGSAGRGSAPGQEHAGR